MSKKDKVQKLPSFMAEDAIDPKISPHFEPKDLAWIGDDSDTVLTEHGYEGVAHISSEHDKYGILRILLTAIVAANPSEQEGEAFRVRECLRLISGRANKPGRAQVDDSETLVRIAKEYWKQFQAGNTDIELAPIIREVLGRAKLPQANSLGRETGQNEEAVVIRLRDKFSRHKDLIMSRVVGAHHPERRVFLKRLRHIAKELQEAGVRLDSKLLPKLPDEEKEPH